VADEEVHQENMENINTEIPAMVQEEDNHNPTVHMEKAVREETVAPEVHPEVQAILLQEAAVETGVLQEKVLLQKALRNLQEEVLHQKALLHLQVEKRVPELQLQREDVNQVQREAEKVQDKVISKIITAIAVVYIIAKIIFNLNNI
jgi:hypothetical protein